MNKNAFKVKHYLADFRKKEEEKKKPVKMRWDFDNVTGMAIEVEDKPEQISFLTN